MDDANTSLLANVAGHDIESGLLADPGPASKISKTNISIDGMCCGSEVPQVKDILEKIQGVIKVEVKGPPAKEATVEHDSAIVTSQGLLDQFKGTAFAGSTVNADYIASPRSLIASPRGAAPIGGCR